MRYVPVFSYCKDTNIFRSCKKTFVCVYIFTPFFRLVFGWVDIGQGRTYIGLISDLYRTYIGQRYFNRLTISLINVFIAGKLL